MAAYTEKLKAQLAKCRNIINKGYMTAKNTGLPWLDGFCMEFLEFSNMLQKYLTTEFDASGFDGNEQIETTFLCLTQITTCVNNLIMTIKAENAGGVAISASRQHFLDRINWCLEKLRSSIKTLANGSLNQSHVPEEKSIVKLMDLVFDQLMPYSSYKEGSSLNLAEKNAEAMFTSKQVRSGIDLILSHTLAFANVALKEDKKALSALCQKVLRECIAFQDECALTEQQAKANDCDRKLRAISLENALYQLEDYINEALLRLIYTVFLDYDKFSIEKLRTVIRVCDPEDTQLDELIADFDVNVDRTTQIGIFAIAFATDMKIKSVVRNCLASLESLDACIIPSLQSRNSNDIHSEILEQHFNEEVANFKLAIQETIDSYAFAACYHELVTQCLAQVEKEFNKVKLQELVQMGQFLNEHLKLEVNHKKLAKQPSGQQLYEKFVLILNECQAILMCANQVDKKRVLKRFKIMRAVLRKLTDSLNDESPKQAAHKKSNIMLMSEELDESQAMFESIGICPSICSILYEKKHTARQRAASDSLKGNYSKLPKTPLHQAPVSSAKPTSLAVNAAQDTRRSVRRKESLRTAIFKRQKSLETEKVFNIYKNLSSSFEISEILDRITNLPSTFSEASALEESFISK